MTTCRSDPRWPRALAVAIIVALAGCSDEQAAGFSLLPQISGPPASAKALSQAPMAGGKLTLRAPDGWCIEPRSVRNTARGSFALLAGCHELTGGAVGAPMPPGYVTVAVGARQIETLTAEAVLEGVTAGQTIEARGSENDVPIVRLASETPETPRWRGAAVIDRRPVLLSVFSPQESALSERTGARLVSAIADDMTGSFAVRDPVGDQVGEAMQTAPDPPERLDAGGLFRRLFDRKVSE